MFKSVRWRSTEKNKLKVVFKLQFHASKVALVGDDEPLMISIVPSDTNKPTLKSDRVKVREGACLWENPLYETVIFNREPKSGKIHEKIYKFVVGNGISKSGVIGEASLDFSTYAEATSGSLVSLPLKNSKMQAMLHVSIQRIHESNDRSEVESDNAMLNHKDHSLRLQVDIMEENGHDSIDDTACDKTISLNRSHRGSSGSDISLSSSNSASGNELPWQPQTKYDLSSEFFAKQNREEFSEIVFEKLKFDFAVLSRQAETWEVELHTLRKQIVVESEKGQNLYREVACLKEERDALKGECEKSRGDCLAFVEELRQELNHEKEISKNLRIQLQKTQESNSELILAVRDLDEMLEQKSQETSNNNGNDDEQKALEDHVNERSETKEGYLLEQQVLDLRSEIEIYKRDKDELVLRMEQLALDYEIAKQENHAMVCKLEQSQVQELNVQIENLEKELELRSSESCESSARISGLEAQIKNLEDELEKQSLGFKADLDSITRSKIDQEHKAVKAEEMLRQTRLHNAKTVEGIQEELKRLSVQMLSAFETNEKVAAKALTEADELRLQKNNLEEMIRKASQDESLKDNKYEVRINQLSGKVKAMTNQLEEMEFEIKKREEDLANQKKHAEGIERVLTDEITELKLEIETNAAAREEMEISVKEMELLVKKGNDERSELENKVLSAKIENEESTDELNKIKILLEDKEVMIRNLRTELDSIQMQYTELKHSMLEHESEKGKLKKQVSTLKSDLKKKEDSINILEKKLRDHSINNRGTSSKIHPRGSKELVTSLKDRIKSLEDQIKLKETDLETSTNRFLETEKDLSRKVEELEERLNGQEIIVLKERNKSMEDELKEMQARYSEISLMFAEVEGERQQLVMKLRNLKNATITS